MPAPPDTLPRGSVRLGPYELLKKIGSGGMAEVWMGRRATAGGAAKAVAIKLMSRALADDTAYRDMFVAEARLSMMLGHSNIVQVFDAGEDDGVAYLAMEWVDGMNLAQILSLRRKAGEERVPLPVVGYVVGEILHALDYAHTLMHEGKPLQVVHRDVSPQNVLVSVSGEVKLTDFGVARLALDETSGVHVKGKLRYMPREQLAGQSRHPGVDLYAVGAILHEMLDGRRFRAEATNEVQLAAQAAAGVIPELRDPSSVPRELDELRRALLQPEPVRRVGSAAAALQMLERWPGYRNASAALGRMCRDYLGVTGPRSGLFDVRSVEDGSSSAPPNGGVPVGGPVTYGGSAVDTEAPTATAWPGRDAAAGVPSRSTPTPTPQASAPGGASPLAVVAGLVFVVAVLGGLGFVALRTLGAAEEPQLAVAEDGGTGGPAEAGATAPPTPQEAALAASPPGAPPAAGAGDPPAAKAPAAGVAPAAAPGPAVAAATEPRSPRKAGARKSPKKAAEPATEGTTLPPPPGLGDLPDPPAAGGGGEAGASKPEAAEPQPARVERVPVSFSLSGPRLAYVRLDGRTYVLEPTAKGRVRVGRRKVQWRLTSGGAWRSGGTFDLEPGKRYRVKVTPSGPVLERM